MKKTLDYKSVSVFVALAAVLQMSESFIPSPVPGLKPGLANMISLVVLVLYGFRPALQVSFFRTLLSSLMTGSFLSPGFLLSMCAAVVSTVMMHLLLSVVRRLPFRSMSLIGISVGGAITHSYVQLFLAYALFIHHAAVFSFLPWLLAGAVVMGWINGRLAIILCQKMEKEILPEEEGKVPFPVYPEASFSRALLWPLFKIILFVLSAAGIFAADQSWILASVLGVAVILFVCSGISILSVLKTVFRFGFFLGMVFCFPLFFEFHSCLTECRTLGLFNFILQFSGFIYVLRLLFLLFMSSWVFKTSSPVQLVQTVSLLLLPLRVFGIDHKKLAHTFFYSWELFPFILREAREKMAGFRLRDGRRKGSFVEQIAGLIYALLFKTRLENKKEGGL